MSEAHDAIMAEFDHYAEYQGYTQTFLALRGAVESILLRDRAPVAGGLRASSTCPVCGNGHPHSHSVTDIEFWVNNLIVRWGYHATVTRAALGRPAQTQGKKPVPSDVDPGSTHWEECPECMGSGWVRVVDSTPPAPAELVGKLVPSETFGEWLSNAPEVKLISDAPASKRWKCKCGATGNFPFSDDDLAIHSGRRGHLLGTIDGPVEPIGEGVET
jgi:hypothetical protein